MYYSGFYPMQLALLTVADNLMPLAWWTPISKAPFRLLIAIDQKNHSLNLLRAHREAVLNFMPWAERERVVRAGYLSGRRVRKAERLGFRLKSAAKLQTTGVVEGAAVAFELVVVAELEGLSGDHAPFVFEVVYVHRRLRRVKREPILFLGYRNFATLGEGWSFKP